MIATTISIVEDNSAICVSLERIIAASGDLRCVSASRNAEHALSIIPQERPDIVLMDIELPGLSGIECTRRLKRLLPDLRILILTVAKDHERIFRALEAGAIGYLLKRSTSRDILQAIRDVKEGGAPLTPEIAAKVVQSFHQSRAATPANAPHLSPRESEILELLAQGYVTKEIADRLAISYDTVRVHLGSLYQKMHVRSRTEAVIEYLRKT